MKTFRTTILPILAAGLWTNLSEFVRNEVLVKAQWVRHYRDMNLEFPSEPANGAIWLVWGFSFAALVFVLSKRFSLLQTTFLAWFAGFFLMWLVVWNLDVLPVGILGLAVPLSLLEAFVCAWIVRMLSAR